jgi:hypothetical protein
MTSTTPRIITIALATLALAAPAANAMPLYEHDGAPSAKPRSTAHIQTGSLAGTVTGQDLRNPDQQAPVPNEPTQDLRNPDQRVPEAVPAQQPPTLAPVHITKPQPAVAPDKGPSPLVFILPSLVLIGILGAATVYAKTSRPVRRSVA